MIERNDKHQYWSVNGHGREELLGVTRTLVESNLIDSEFFTDLSRGRGKFVHYIAERLVTNRPLEDGIHESVLGYVIGLRKFLDRHAPQIHGAEVVKGDTVRKLAGTVDLDLFMEGGRGIVEIKTSNPTPWHGLQLAPYAYLLDGPKWLDRARWGLYLTPNGGYRLKEYDDHTDLDYFLRAHELLLWRCRYGNFERPYGRRHGIRFDNDAIPNDPATIGGSGEDGYPSADYAGDDSGEIPF